MSFKQIPKQFNVIPVSNKIPQTAWKEYTTRLQTQEEKNEFLKSKEVGIVTGPVSRILVLDDDGGLSDHNVDLPRTWVANTPRGGRHYYFKWVDQLDSKITTKVGLWDKVDVRGEGGYVVWYGLEKPYTYVPLAPPPQWLIDLLPNKERSQAANVSSEIANKSQIQELLDGIKPGNRNDSFTRIAGSLRARGYGVDDIFGMLSPKAREVGFADRELRIICDSVGRYKPRFETSTTSASSVEEFLKDEQKVEWIVPGIIAKNSLHFVAGLNGTMKTWTVIDLAIECARGGGLWLNKFPANAAKVWLIDQERFKGETQRRLKAVIGAKQISPSELRNTLMLSSGTTTRLDLPQSFDAFHKQVSEIKPDLIIVDSFATIHTKNENLRQEIQGVLEKIKEIRNEFGCAFVFIHHENGTAYSKENQGDPNTGQMSGSEAIPAAAEIVLTVRKQDNESSMIYQTKNNLGSKIAPFLVKVSDVDEAKTTIKVEAY